MSDNPEENRLDRSLRDTFENYELRPTPTVWTGIERRLAMPPPGPPRQRRPLLPLLLLTALLAGLAGWLLPHTPATATRQPASPKLVASPASKPQPTHFLAAPAPAAAGPSQAVSPPPTRAARPSRTTARLLAATQPTSAAVPATAATTAASPSPAEVPAQPQEVVALPQAASTATLPPAKEALPTAKADTSNSFSSDGEPIRITRQIKGQRLIRKAAGTRAKTPN